MRLPWPLRLLFFVQDFLGGLYVAIGMLFYWIMPYSHSHSLSVLWAFLGGLYAAIGMLFYWIMPYSHSHSLSVLWAFSGRALCAHWDAVLLDNSIVTPAFPLPHYFGLVCFIPSPPAISFTYPFHTNRSASASLTSSA